MNRQRFLPGFAATAKAMVLFVFSMSAGLAQIPAGPNCTVDQPPPDAGAFGTPGGFLLVHPRNAGLSDRYTGCKTLWVVDAPDRYVRLVTLYFQEGRLRVAQSYNKDGSSRGTCTLPGRSPACEDVESNPMAALRLATWPRVCITSTHAPQCTKDPD